MKTKLLKVYEYPGAGWRTIGALKPMIRISNKELLTCGFAIGVPIQIQYDTDKITITRLNNTYEPNIPESRSAQPLITK